MITATDTTDAAEVERLEAEVRATLSPEHLELALQWVLAAVADTDAARDRAADQFETTLVDELTRHFGCLGPAIRVVVMHLGEQRLSDVGRCCTGADDAD